MSSLDLRLRCRPVPGEDVCPDARTPLVNVVFGRQRFQDVGGTGETMFLAFPIASM